MSAAWDCLDYLRTFFGLMTNYRDGVMDISGYKGIGLKINQSLCETLPGERVKWPLKTIGCILQVNLLLQ